MLYTFIHLQKRKSILIILSLNPDKLRSAILFYKTYCACSQPETQHQSALLCTALMKCENLRTLSATAVLAFLDRLLHLHKNPSGKIWLQPKAIFMPNRTLKIQFNNFLEWLLLHYFILIITQVRLVKMCPTSLFCVICYFIHVLVRATTKQLTQKTHEIRARKLRVLKMQAANYFKNTELCLKHWLIISNYFHWYV